MRNMRQTERVTTTDTHAANPHARVLFIGGSAKSGSTLLGALLGQQPVLFNAGEMNLFWAKWLDPGERCGCGERLTECAFWAAVVADVEDVGIAPTRMAELSARLDHTRQLPRVLSRSLRRNTAGAWAELVAGTDRLYASAFRRSRAAFIVDGSKLPTHLMLLRDLPDVDVRVLHLIRDGRAVAFSWERKRRLARAGEPQGSGMRRHRFAAADFAIWHLQNFSIDRLARRFNHATRIRYEALATAPATALRDALERLEVDLAGEATASEGLGVASGHAVGGNDRVRFAGAGTTVAVDEAWKTELRGLRLRLWTVLAAPGLRHFGYPLRVLRSGRAT